MSKAGESETIGSVNSGFSQYVKKENFKDLSLWVRLVLGVGYILLLNILLPCMGVLALIQFLLILLFSKPYPLINQINSWLIDFFQDSLRYLTLQTEQKPFPFTLEVGQRDDNIET